MINAFCTFFEDGKETSYFKMNETNKKIKTNKRNFNLKFYSTEINIDKLKITKYALKIDKNINGSYKSFGYKEGFVDELDNSVNFNSCILGDTNDPDGTYRVYFEFYSGGIVVYNGVTESFTVDLKTKCTDFTIEFDNSKQMNSIIEIQSETGKLDELKFYVNLPKDFDGFNTLQCGWIVSPEEKVDIPRFNPLLVNNKEFLHYISESTFKENSTYLHFFMKDTNTNVEYKKIKVITKDNSLSIFEIKNSDSLIKTLDGVNHIYFEQRYVDNIRAIVKTINDDMSASVSVSPKYIGLYNKPDGILEFDFNDNFPGVNFSKVKNVNLYFELNKSGIYSNTINYVVDSDVPVISLSNLEDDNYICIKDDISFFELSGTVHDDNMFYISANHDLYKFDTFKNTIIIPTDDLAVGYTVEKDGLEYPLVRYGDISSGTFDFNLDEFVIKTINGTVTECPHITDYSPSGTKPIFFNLQKNKLSPYEKNIIHNGGGLIVKSELAAIVESYDFVEFGDYYILKCIVPESECGEFKFDIGIEGWDYSFLKHISHGNCSSKITSNKLVSLDFEHSIIAISLGKMSESIIKVDSGKFNTKLPLLKHEKVKLGYISANLGDLIATDDSTSFLNSYLNFPVTKDLYQHPVVRNKSSEEIEYVGYKMVRSSENIYSFLLSIPVENGLNDFVIEFSDESGNVAFEPFTIEKNTDDIELCIDKKFLTKANYNQDETGHYIHTKGDNVRIKLVVNNENVKQKNAERFIKMICNKTTSYHKVLDEVGVQVCPVEIVGLTGEYSKCEFFYGDLSDPLIEINVKKVSNLFIDCESEFVSGMNEYYLNYTKEDFAILNISITNPDVFSYVLHDKYVKIIRNNNDRFIEDVGIKITSHDKGSMFLGETKTINGRFYNEDMIADYWITVNGEKVDPGKIIRNTSYDLHIKSYELENLKGIYVNDTNEYDFYKRKKYASFDLDSSVATISGIITPLKPSSILVSFIPEGINMEIKKSLYDSFPIYYKYDEKKFSSSVSYEDETIVFTVKSEIFDSDTPEKHDVSCIEFYVNGSKVAETTDIKFDKFNSFVYKVENIVIDRLCEFICKVKTEDGRMYFTNTTELLLSGYGVSVEITNINKRNVFEPRELTVFDISVHGSKFTNYDLFIEVNDECNNTYMYPAVRGSNINSFIREEGTYMIRAVYKKGNILVHSQWHSIQLFNSKETSISLTDVLYSKIPLVNYINIESKYMFDASLSNSYIHHYVNGSLMKIYSPVITGKKLRFNIEKRIGNNTFVYVDDFTEKQLPGIAVTNNAVQRPELKSFSVENNGLFYKEGNTYMLEIAATCLLTFYGVEKIIIDSLSGRSIEKYIKDDTDVTILKNLIPCHVRVFSKSGAEVDGLNFAIDINEHEKADATVEPVSSLGNISKVKFNLQHESRINLSSTIRLGSLFRRKHPALSHLDSFALINGMKWWNSLERDEKINFIKENSKGILKIDDAIAKVVSKMSEIGGKNVK